MNRAILLLVFGFSYFYAGSQTKLFEDNKNIKYMAVCAYYYDKGWKHHDEHKVYFTKNKKLINTITNWNVSTDEYQQDVQYANFMYYISIFDKNKEIIGRKTLYIRDTLRFPEDISSKYVQNKTDSITLTIDFFNTYFKKIAYTSKDSLTHTELKKQISKRKQLVFYMHGYLNRAIYPLEKNLYIEYPGTFHIHRDFYEFGGDDNKEVENAMRKMIAEKLPDKDYEMQFTGRSAIKRDKKGKEFFTWKFIIYSGKDFYDGIKAVKDFVNVPPNYDWAEYKYNIWLIDL